MSPRALIYGVLGWLIPFILVLPLTRMREPVGGGAVIAAGVAWLLLFGPIGCAVAGWFASRLGQRSTAFWSGLVGVVPAVVAVFAVDALVSVLTIGGVAFALILPLALGYGVGFAAGSLIRRRV